MAARSRSWAAGVVGDGDRGADDPRGAAAFGHVGEEHRGAGIDELGVEVAGLAGGGGEVPGVDEQVHERARRRLQHGPLEPERRRAGPRQRARIGESQQAGVDARSEVLDRCAGRRGRLGAGEGGAEVAGAADEVVEQVLHRPVRARRRPVELVGSDPGGDPDRIGGGSAVEVDGFGLAHHAAPRFRRPKFSCSAITTGGQVRAHRPGRQPAPVRAVDLISWVARQRNPAIGSVIDRSEPQSCCARLTPWKRHRSLECVPSRSRFQRSPSA